MKTKIVLSAITVTFGLANNISACKKFELSQKFKEEIITQRHLLEHDAEQLLKYIETHQDNPKTMQEWFKSAGILKKIAPSRFIGPTLLPNQQLLLVALSLLLPQEVNNKLETMRTSNQTKHMVAQNFISNLTTLSATTLKSCYPPNCKWLYQCAKCAELIKAAAEEAKNLKK